MHSLNVSGAIFITLIENCLTLWTKLYISNIYIIYKLIFFDFYLMNVTLRKVFSEMKSYYYFPFFFVRTCPSFLVVYIGFLFVFADLGLYRTTRKRLEYKFWGKKKGKNSFLQFKLLFKIIFYCHISQANMG